MKAEDARNKLCEINDKIVELQQEYFTCNIDSLKSWQIEYELDYLYDLKNRLIGFKR